MSIFGFLQAHALERKLIVALVGLLAATAWVVLWSVENTNYGVIHHHHDLHTLESAPGASWAIFIAGWTLMTVAMMLPTTLPVLVTFHAIAQQRSDKILLVALAISGYLAVWSLFGVFVLLGNLIAQRVVVILLGTDLKIAVGSGIVLLMAGIFQFTSLKYRCLDKCRSPLSFVIERWQGKNHRLQAFRLGVDHGIFCVGCCWALMLLMFVVGIGSLGWMLVLAIVMAVEKNVSWGRRISAPIGIALLLGGTIMLSLGLLQPIR